MDSTFKFLGFGASVVICSLLAGCSEGTDDPAGTGGTTGTTGGSTGQGGSTGITGGSTGTGGGTSSGATKLFTFDIDEEGFKFNPAPATQRYTNLADPAVGAAPKLEYVSNKDAGNDPNSGALRITAEYTFWNQSVAAEVAPPLDKNGAPMDFTHKTVTARVFIEPMGLSPNGFSDPPDAPGGIVFYMKSGAAYDWGQAAWLNATTYGTWFSVKFNADALDTQSSKPGFDPGNVVQLGLSFSSGGGGVHCPDDAASDPNHAAYMGKPTATCPAWEAPLPTTIYIDSVTVTPN